jgi:hypothetical protein
MNEDTPLRDVAGTVLVNDVDSAANVLLGHSRSLPARALTASGADRAAGVCGGLVSGEAVRTFLSHGLLHGQSPKNERLFPHYNRELMFDSRGTKKERDHHSCSLFLPHIANMGLLM